MIEIRKVEESALTDGKYRVEVVVDDGGLALLRELAERRRVVSAPDQDTTQDTTNTIPAELENRFASITYPTGGCDPQHVAGYYRARGQLLGEARQYVPAGLVHAALIIAQAYCNDNATFWSGL